MSRPRAVFTDFPGADLDLERELLGNEGIDAIAMDPDRDLAEQVDGVAAIVTCFGLVPGRAIEASNGLLTVARYGVGVDNIDVARATAQEVLVTNVPSYCEDEVAEHSIGLLFACARRIAALDRQVREGGWARDPERHVMYRVSGKVLGLVGFGRTARAVAWRAQGLGLSVIACSPRTSDEDFAAAGVEGVGLDELLARSHFVSLHTSLTDETRGLIGREELAAMRDDAVLLNVARGGIVDSDALVDAIRERAIAGAALDVFDPEVMPADHALRQLDEVIVTPHVAFYSEESMIALRRLTMENVLAVLNGRTPASVVNPDVLQDARWQGLLARGSVA